VLKIRILDSRDAGLLGIRSKQLHAFGHGHRRQHDASVEAAPCPGLISVKWPGVVPKEGPPLRGLRPVGNPP
jgi:hypothetical protein